MSLMCPSSQRFKKLNVLAGVGCVCVCGGVRLRSAVFPLKTYLHPSQGQHKRAGKSEDGGQLFSRSPPATFSMHAHRNAKHYISAPLLIVSHFPSLRFVWRHGGTEQEDSEFEFRSLYVHSGSPVVLLQALKCHSLITDSKLPLGVSV